MLWTGCAGIPADWKNSGVKVWEGGHVGREAVALVQPVGLPEFADDVAPLVEFTEDQFAHVGDFSGQCVTGCPVGVDQGVRVDREGVGSGEAGEVELGGFAAAGVDQFLVGPGLRLGQGIEERRPTTGCDAADVLDGAFSTVDALPDLAGVGVLFAEEVGVVDLELADFVEVGGGDAAAGGAAGLALQDVDAVVLPGQVEEPVDRVGDEAALVDGEAAQGVVAVVPGVGALPEELAGIGHDAAADGQVGDVGIGYAAGQQVELEAGHGVPGVGPAVYFHDSGHGVFAAGGFAQLVHDFEDDAALAFVAGGDAGVGNQL